MANERTLLAYSRTSLMLFATGATMLKLLGDTLALQLVGWGVIAFGIAIAIWGLLRFRQFRLRCHVAEESSDSLE